MNWNDWAVLGFSAFSAATGGVMVWDIMNRRPIHAVKARVYKENPLPGMSQQNWGGGKYMAEVKNFGTTDLRDVTLFGIGAKISKGTWRRELQQLAPGKSVTFTVDSDNLETAWFLIAYTPSSEVSKWMYIEWFSMLEQGPLAEVRNRQVVSARLRRAIARRVFRLPPSPATYERLRVLSTPEQLAKLQLTQSSSYGTPKSTWLLRWLLPKPEAEFANGEDVSAPQLF
ncbi:hypothetical protein WG936_08065 [Corynebacterium sp. H127]|uniref:hypothetical protein n=1 Tax=Corynebacterium sp. H127 TaxID=3133418 RepID=UPI0030B38027